MATRDQIQREMESIRSMRRISSQSGPGSLTLDPDLPPQSPGSALSPSSEGDEDVIIPGGAGGAFFWVPASLHPELAPSEFKAFLRDHRREVEEGAEQGTSPISLGRVGSIGLQRSASGLSRSSSGLARKRSMLSRQYDPTREGDDDDQEGGETSIKRNRSTYSNAAPQLTIKDLQKLDDLADAAASGNRGEANLIRSQLRRSMSLGLPGGILDQIDAVPEDEENAPVIVPAKALTRTARTRIRKPHLEGDGGGHRFGSSRRGRRGKTMDAGMGSDSQHFDSSTRPMSDATTSEPASISDHEGEPYQRPQAPSPEALDGDDTLRQPRFAGTGRAEYTDRPESMGEIYDAYGDNDAGEVYFDARESASFEKDPSKHPNDISPDHLRDRATYDIGEEVPFFAGPSSVPMAPSPASSTTEAPTVILRPHSPETASEELPLTQKGVPREQRPGPIELPPSQYTPYKSPTSNPSFVKEYGYQQQYDQSVPPNQMYQQQHSTGLHHPSPKRHLDVPPSNPTAVSPPSSPEMIRSPSVSPSSENPYNQRPTSSDKKAEKEKGKGRGLFGWSSGKDKDKKEEKDKKEKDILKKQKKEKSEGKSAPKEEKETGGGGGLFGNFFGGGKKKGDGESPASVSANQANPQAGKPPGSKGQLVPFATVSPAVAGQYARYPLHVERAVYRLSHIKLANPRRPLYEQVLISNLMFWYLGIINKPAVPPTPPSDQAKLPPTGEGAPPNNAQPQLNANGQPIMTTSMSPAQQAAAAQAAAAERARVEQEQREKEQREHEEREREMLEMQERERREREREQKERMERMERERQEKEREKSTKKTGLTKADREGKMRKAEMPIRTPNYDIQSRSMEYEPVSNGRPNTAPGGTASSGMQSGGMPTAYHLPVRVQQRTGSGPQQPYFHQQDMSQALYQPMNPYALPPGAKPPAPVENTWAVTSNASANQDIRRGQSRSPPPHQTLYSSGTGPADRPRPTRSPPPHDYLASAPPAGNSLPNGARPSRSMSAASVNRSSVPGSTGSFSSNGPSPSVRAVDYGPSHQHTQSAGANLGNSSAPNNQPTRLLKKKSTSSVPNNGPSDGTRPIARSRRSTEIGAGDRRGMIDTGESFEAMWQQFQSQGGGFGQSASQMNQQEYASYGR
ncbi:hypothetical protein CPB86DRAFT_797563 [Serendipita vermifera]|nr:hypothetical protein CPB86DRAFT_797563 [Serendipita vermifera]